MWEAIGAGGPCLIITLLRHMMIITWEHSSNLGRDEHRLAMLDGEPFAMTIWAITI